MTTATLTSKWKITIPSAISEKNLGYVTLISLIEITWVLESCYEQTKEDLINMLGLLLTIK